MSEEALKENKMGVMPMPKLMLSMGLPMIISMIVQAFYNIVDSYFVSRITDDTVEHIGEYAVNALTLAYPVQLLIIAVGVGTGVGINALLSRSLGEKNFERAGKIAGNAIFIGLCTYIVFMLFGFFGTDAFLLADFAKARHKDIVCDLGTGCGIIAVLMRLRYEPKQVYGVDIQPQAIEQF